MQYKKVEFDISKFHSLNVISYHLRKVMLNYENSY